MFLNKLIFKISYIIYNKIYVNLFDHFEFIDQLFNYVSLSTYLISYTQSRIRCRSRLRFKDIKFTLRASFI